MLRVQPESQPLRLAAAHKLDGAVRGVVGPHGAAHRALVKAEQVRVCSAASKAQHRWAQVDRWQCSAFRSGVGLHYSAALHDCRWAAQVGELAKHTAQHSRCEEFGAGQ